MNHTKTARMLSTRLLFLLICITLAFVSGCGRSGLESLDEPEALSVPEPEPGPIVVTEFDLTELLSLGLPLVLNFGNDNHESQHTLANLEKINQDYHQHILIRSVDLAANPQAREGFPNLNLMPSQFFYTADAEPIGLPLHLGVLMSLFLSIDTQEPVFTMHDGPLTEDELLRIIEYMGVPVVR